MMNFGKISFYICPLLLLLVGCVSPSAPDSDGSRTNQKPNILLIVADDLGIECLEAYGGQSYDTPNLNQLAEEGRRFTHAFSTPVCSPSRAQLLTGRYPLHNGIRRVIFDPERHLEYLDPAKETTFASLLQEEGYSTAFAGKWQLSFLHERDIISAHGFDEYQAWQIFKDGSKTSRYFNPVFRRNGTVLDKELEGRFGPDVNVEFLKTFIRNNRYDPFFAYYAALLPHWPWVPTPDSDEPLRMPDDRGDPAFFPDMVAYLDQQVGRLLETLEQLGIRENTIVLFTGDNGTDQEIVSRWKEDGKIRTVNGGKGTMSDRGTRVPLIASWPGVVSKDTVNHDLIDFSDLFPTIVELAGAEVPEKLELDGRSFAPQLRGNPGTPREWIHVQRKGLRYVRGRKYIFTIRKKLRPVVRLDDAPAEPISRPFNDEQLEARERLKSALEKTNSTKR